ncbi:MAG: hypothetical protein WBQ73_02135 [Candidatus Babeliales bacterium]
MNYKNDNVLVCKKVKFYCHKDEDAFFNWIKKIECIDQTSAAGDELFLHVASQELHDQDLRDLIGLFYRYNIDMKQLARFLTNENKTWFYDNKKAFWHQKVF